MNTKIFYTINDVSKITTLPQDLIRYYIRVLKKTIAPEHYPDINPRQVKGEFLFTRKDIDEILRFIDKRKDESWEKWQLRVIKETMAKRESKQEAPGLHQLAIGNQLASWFPIQVDANQGPRVVSLMF